jgi:AhpD family alkylhydroperoxidase
MPPIRSKFFCHALLFVHRSHSLFAIRHHSDESKFAGRDKESRVMQARMKNPVMIIPDAMQALSALKASIDKGGLPKKTPALVALRASQINGCSLCVDMHARELKAAGETDERLFAVAAWRDAPYFSDAERAALALTEAVTRLSDQPDPVPDAIWQEAASHYDERSLSALILSIGLINIWNRLNVTTKQVAGEWVKSDEGRKWLETHAAAAR